MKKSVISVLKINSRYLQSSALKLVFHYITTTPPHAQDLILMHASFLRVKVPSLITPNTQPEDCEITLSQWPVPFIPRARQALSGVRTPTSIARGIIETHKPTHNKFPPAVFFLTCSMLISFWFNLFISRVL